ncbi:methyltransferase domain-containing protein [Actinoplanes sp. NPDC051475]|uniref:class I SAM-dependent methyltransferase n=1 Tax=Actinoplanes sp. NPDC051475 TaxID=3157225 RepID=UPI00344FEDEB
MGDTWFHGDWAVQKAGGSAQEAATAMLRRLTDHAGLRPGSRVLEFGAGAGGGAVQMAAMTGATVVGLSNTDSLTVRARRLAAERGVSDLTAFVTVGDEDYKKLAAWPSKSFDAVLFMESVCHLSNKKAFFKAAHRIVKPGGRLVGLDWIQRPYGQYQTSDDIASLIDPVCEHFRLARPMGTLDSYTAMMRSAGFDVTHAEDEFAGELCMGSTEAPDVWMTYEGRSGELIRIGKQALDAARAAGVFTVGWWSALRT